MALPLQFQSIRAKKRVTNGPRRQSNCGIGRCREPRRLHRYDRQHETEIGGEGGDDLETMTSGVSSRSRKPRNSSTPSSLRTTRATAASLNLWTANVQRSSRYPLRSAAEPAVEAPGRLLSPRSQPKTCGRPTLAIFVVRGRSSPPAKIRKRIAQAVATARRAAARRQVPRAARASPLAPPSSDHRHLAVVSRLCVRVLSVLPRHSSTADEHEVGRKRRGALLPMDQAHGDGAPLEPRLIAAVTPPPPGARFAQLDAFAHASPVKPRSLVEARIAASIPKAPAKPPRHRGKRDRDRG